MPLIEIPPSTSSRSSPKKKNSPVRVCSLPALITQNQFLILNLNRSSPVQIESSLLEKLLSFLSQIDTNSVFSKTHKIRFNDEYLSFDEKSVFTISILEELKKRVVFLSSFERGEEKKLVTSKSVTRKSVKKSSDFFLYDPKYRHFISEEEESEVLSYPSLIEKVDYLFREYFLFIVFVIEKSIRYGKVEPRIPLDEVLSSSGEEFFSQFEIVLGDTRRWRIPLLSAYTTFTFLQRVTDKENDVFEKLRGMLLWWVENEKKLNSFVSFSSWEIPQVHLQREFYERRDFSTKVFSMESSDESVRKVQTDEILAVSKRFEGEENIFKEWYRQNPAFAPFSLKGGWQEAETRQGLKITSRDQYLSARNCFFGSANYNRQEGLISTSLLDSCDRIIGRP